MTSSMGGYSTKLIRIRCPHCKKVTEKFSRGHYETTYGSPVRRCVYCGKTFFNDEYKEYALYLFGYTGKIGVAGLLTAIMFNSIMIYIVVLFFSCIYHGTPMFGLPLYLLITVGLAWACNRHVLAWIYGFLNTEELHRKMVDRIEGRSGKQTAELRESVARLSSREYLDTLRGCGIYVPEYFYQRLEEKPSLQMTCSKSFPEPLSGKQIGPMRWTFE